MKQWRDDVNRLLGMAHSGSTRPRPRSSWRQHEASAFVRSPSVRAAPTEDLRAELNRRHAGEEAQSLWGGLTTCGQNSTAGARARMPVSL
jgi:hypothetical protein